MKAAVIQPFYSTDSLLMEELFQQYIDLLDQCDESLDLIVLPEACDVPCYVKTPEEFRTSYQKFNGRICAKARETAKRCNAVLFFNATRETETGMRNTTYAVNNEGEIVGFYDKQHLTNTEVLVRKLDSDYTFEFSEPIVIEINGIRYGFLTCYDFYFYEAFANIARQKVDIIIGCSHQRSDPHHMIDLITRFCAYNCNAYVVRASVSMYRDGAGEAVGGYSMVAAPDGTTLLHADNKIGIFTTEIDPHKKFYKPMGYGNPPGPHYEYIEEGRRPYKYRAAGSAIIMNDIQMPYPRVCAHRGFSTVAPENSMPAFGAATALGAEEIEFDLWVTKDREIVSIHDSDLDRVSDGSGFVWDYTYEELLRYDFGSKFGEQFAGLSIVKFEDILRKFAGHVIMNIHIKTRDLENPYDTDLLRKIIALIDRYDCRKYVYFMVGNDTVLKQLRELAPDISRCCGAGREPYRIVERAITHGCRKVQLFKPYFNQEMIDKAHEQGIICNMFWSDDADETKKFLDMGIDVILTNDYWRIAQTVKKWKEVNRPQ